MAWKVRPVVSASKLIPLVTAHNMKNFYVALNASWRHLYSMFSCQDNAGGGSYLTRPTIFPRKFGSIKNKPLRGVIRYLLMCTIAACIHGLLRFRTSAHIWACAGMNEASGCRGTCLHATVTSFRGSVCVSGLIMLMNKRTSSFLVQVKTESCFPTVSLCHLFCFSLTGHISLKYNCL